MKQLPAWYRFFRVYLIYSSYFKIYFCSCSKELSRFDYLSFLAPESHFRVSRSLCTFSSLVVQFSRTIACLPLALCDLFIISHFLAFVKGFCKSFLSFFLSSFALPFLASLGCDLYIISHFQAFVKWFWESFLNLFQSRLARCRSWRDLYIISYFLAFVKRFCKSFSKVFCRPCGLLSRSSLVDSSYIIAQRSAFVNRFFKKSWNIFAVLFSPFSLHGIYSLFT